MTLQWKVLLGLLGLHYHSIAMAAADSANMEHSPNIRSVNVNNQEQPNTGMLLPIELLLGCFQMK
jgi:hypothetical protein